MIAYIVIIFLISVVSGFLFSELRTKNRIIKNMTAALNQKDESIKLVQNNYRQLDAKQEFEKDDTLAKFLFRVIVQRQKMQIHEIDASLATMHQGVPFCSITPSITIVERMQIKNELVQLNWMEQGIVPVAIDRTYNKKEDIN